MKSIQSIVRPVVVALAFAVCAAPVAAFAGDRQPAAGEAKQGKRHFPMTAESFNKRIEARITHMRERLTQMLAARKVPEAKQAEIKKDFEAGATAIRAAASRAGADGSVTKAEAKEVRDLAKDLKRKAREKYMPGKGHGKGHDKKSENVG